MSSTWVEAPDGARIAVHRAGGTGARRERPTVVGLHATGFCGPVLKPLAEADPGGRHWVLPDLRGHGLSSWPPGSEDRAWEALADDVAVVVDALAPHRPPIGFGHSAGGAALVMAEAARPGTFAALYLYEPVIWPDPDEARARARHLADGARRRRASFADRGAARDRLSGRPPLDRFDPAALEAYLDGGFAASEDGTLELRCRPDVEAAWYRLGASSAAFDLLAAVRCPVVVATGLGATSLGPALARTQVRALRAGTLELLDGLGHFGPMEDPAAVARAMDRALGEASAHHAGPR